MKRLGILIAGIPVAFALLRAVTTRTDFRYLWLAAASTVGAAIILGVARRASAPVRLSLSVVGVTCITSLTGFAQGATSAPAVAFVAVGFAVCSSAGLALAARKEP